MPTLLVTTWDNGLFHVVGKSVRHEHPGQKLRGLATDGHSGILVITDGHTLCRRSADGPWTDVAKSAHPMSCCVAIGSTVFVGTDDAEIIRVDPDGTPHRLTGFDAIPGRDTWYAGTAIIDGKVMGPPLGIRSMTATCDNAVLLANVHVGGIPRSTDSGRTWQPTIDIEADVHQVCAHPTHPEIVIAASAKGLCISRDAGKTWTVTDDGLHAPHCTAVAFGRHDLFISASTDPFTPQGAVYRRPIDGNGPMQRLGGGMPTWTNGVVDTGCIAARDSLIAMIDPSGCIYVSQDDGETWTSYLYDGLTGPSGIYIG